LGDEEDTSSIENVIRQRMEGIRLKRPETIKEVVNAEIYSRFDDWPPGSLMLGKDALKSEADALKVLDDYRYTISGLAIRVIGDAAIASFYMQYDGMIRKRSFVVESRVSIVLAKKESQWRIIHEHFSMRPAIIPSLASKPLEEVKVPAELRDDLEEAILKVLSDGSERSAADIAREVSGSLGREVETSQVVEKCRELVSKGMIGSQGRFYPKYKLRPV
jgi:hypothetical protein